MKGGSDWKKLPPVPVDVVEGALLQYKVVRQMFGWKQNASIKQAVYAGKLKRVRTGTASHSFRITAESALALRAELVALSESARFFEKTPGQMKALKEAKKRRDATPVPELNVAEIVRQADNLCPAPVVSAPPMAAPVPAPQSADQRVGAYQNAKGTARVTAYRALTWQERNHIIEAERQPEPQFDLVAYRERVARRGY